MRLVILLSVALLTGASRANAAHPTTYVYVLLGGTVRDRIKAYANAWYQVPRTPEDFARAAKAAPSERPEARTSRDPGS